MEQTTKRYLSIAASIAIHSLLLFLIARFTMDLTSPEGTVSDGTLEMEMLPQGSQTSTQNVSVTPVAANQATPAEEPPPSQTVATALPEKKSEPAAVAPAPQEPAPSTAPPSAIQSETVQDSDFAAEVASDSATNSAIDPNSESSTAPTTTLQEVQTGVLPPVAVEQDQAGTADNPGSATGSGAVADQNYGIPSGATDAKTLGSMPGNRRPEYPLMARFRRIQGKTVAQFTVGADGAVTNPRIFSAEHDSFKQPVLDAIKTWKFKGPITPGEYYWAFDFKLAGQETEAPGRLRRK